MRGLIMLVTTLVLCAAIGGLLYAADSGGQASSRPASQPASKPASQPTSRPANPRVVIETNHGDITVELDQEHAPATVANFLRYADEKFYDNTVFHRVIKGFMIQGGGFDTSLDKKATHPPVINESKGTSSNQRGTLAMARTPDPNSATSQFFINLVHNNRLDYPAYGGGYAVFGRVVDGMDVVDKIASVPVQRTEVSEAQPLENVVIRSIHRK